MLDYKKEEEEEIEFQEMKKNTMKLRGNIDWIMSVKMNISSNNPDTPQFYNENKKIMKYNWSHKINIKLSL